MEYEEWEYDIIKTQNALLTNLLKCYPSVQTILKRLDQWQKSIDVSHLSDATAKKCMRN